MKYIFAFIICIISYHNVFAHSAEGRYNSLLTRDGTLIFVMPERLKDLEGISKFEYDMTLLSWNDSVTVNFTFESKLITPPTNISIYVGSTPIKCDHYSILFTDIKKKHYEIRVTSRFDINEIKTVIESQFPPRFCFTQGSEKMSAAYKPKSWIIDQMKLKDIYQLYLLCR